MLVTFRRHVTLGWLTYWSAAQWMELNEANPDKRSRGHLFDQQKH
jgi:hypothetical protein